MKTYILLINIILLSLLNIFSSCKEDPEIINTDDTYPEGSFEYSEVAEHPRLLMNEDDKERLIVLISADEDLKKIHNFILASCNQMAVAKEVEYKLTGKRLLDVSREALKRIFYLSYGYRMTGSQIYLSKAKAELNAVCNFPDWNPDHFLDVGEMCMGVAIGYDWLYDELVPVERSKIINAISKFAFVPSTNSSYSWFYDRSNNWNQVCNAGLVYGALAILESSKKTAVAIIEKALDTNLLALEGYAPNGNYPEGAMYWGYGTSFEVMMLAALESAFGSDNGLSETDGFLNTAEYMLYMCGTSGYRFNYSDCTNSQAPKPAMFWFAKKLDDPSILYEEAKMIALGKYASSTAAIMRLLPLAMIYSQPLNINMLSKPEKKVWYGEGPTPVVLVRTGWEGTSGSYLGIKAGKASTSHGHMDAGSFVYEVDGVRWAEDFGYQSYESVENAGVDLWNMGQNSERWDVFRLNNKNHNTLTINNGRHKVDGEATFVEVYETSAKMGAKVDLTDALSPEEKLESAVRTVTLEDESYLKVVDELKTKEEQVEVYWNMVTSASAKLIDAKTIQLTLDGKTSLLEFSSENEFTLENNRPTQPAQSYESSNTGKTMVGFTATIPPNSEAVFTVTLKGAD